MRMLLLIVATSVGFGFHAANATMRSLTPQEQASTCYPSSPMLYSDACWGSPYMSGLPQSDMYRTQQNDPFSEMYTLMNALQGQSGGGMDAMMGLNLDPTMMWQNSNTNINFPMQNSLQNTYQKTATPIVR